MKIYYVGARLLKSDSALLGSYDEQLHCTIAYSRTWFPYKPAKIYPLLVKSFTIDLFNGITVLRLESAELENRHEELLKAGASWDYPDYKPHISIQKPNLHLTSLLYGSFCLEEEYYMTWEESSK